MINAPIGIFDSGLGGLTVLQSLENSLPNESFIYFGDTARVPYGNKSAETVIYYSKQIVEFLQNHHVKMVIVACNTSSALAIESMKSQFEIPIFGVIDPAVKFIEELKGSDSVVVLGTRATIESQAYSTGFKKLNSSKKVIERSCPLFVPIIEEGLISGKITSNIIDYYLSEFKNNTEKQFILGCTHYPILKSEIQKILGKDTQLVTSGEALIPVLINFMKDNMFFSNSTRKKTQFYISDLPQKFYEIGSRFLGRELKNITHINNF